MISESAEKFMPDDHSTAESTSSWGVVDMDHVEDEGDAAQVLNSSSGSEHVWCGSSCILIARIHLYPSQHSILLLMI
jgi:hypothetical protein